MREIRRYHAGDQLLAIHVPSNYEGNGINFFTPPDLSQQMAQMRRPKDYIIEAHNHRLNQREIFYTNEALFVRSGSARVDLYDNKCEYVGSLNISKGDVLLLVSGGHGFKMLEECDMIEIKQGPYAGDCDKNRIPSINEKYIKDAEFSK